METSTLDRYDEEAAEMLPDAPYLVTLVATFRVAVAARLRGDGEKIDRLVNDFKNAQVNWQGVLDRAATEIAQLKRVVQKAGGLSAMRCLCVFDVIDDSAPVIQCDYHKEMAAEIKRLQAKTNKLRELASHNLDEREKLLNKYNRSIDPISD